MDSKRKLRLDALHRQYRRADVEPQRCFYCRMPSTTLDHVPPLTAVEALGKSYFEEQRIALLLFPSCRSCNVMLGNRFLNTIEERAVYLADVLRAKLSRTKAKRWSNEELEELGRGLRDYIEQSSNAVELLQRRLSACEELSGISRPSGAPCRPF